MIFGLVVQDVTRSYDLADWLNLNDQKKKKSKEVVLGYDTLTNVPSKVGASKRSIEF